MLNAKFLLPDFSTVMLGLIEYGETNARFEQYSGEVCFFTIAEVFITVTVADSFSDLDLVVEALELAGADWVDGMGS